MANKKDLVDMVAAKRKLSGNAANEVVNDVLSSIQELTIKDGHLGLARHGVYEIHERAERKGRNMQTGELMTIPATRVPVFHASREFREKAK